MTVNWFIAAFRSFADLTLSARILRKTMLWGVTAD
jgi:hypothetical protein